MSRDAYNNLLVKQTLIPAVRNASANGTAVDRNEDGCGFQSALVVVNAGTVTDGTHTIEVQDSDDGTNFTAVADAYLQGAEPAIVAADDNKVFEIGYLGLRRYLRVVLTVSGSPATGAALGAFVVLAEPSVAPVVRN
uniref:hypothetical protein n=1 Tax=Herbidospora sakaeratensis TaxID=564415 RepID=UPI0007842500|nr:hypothetical protein [Herbidospora sakaeratensis]